MIDIHLSLSPDGSTTSQQPHARFWIDSDISEGLANEIEIRMVPQGPRAWHGSFDPETIGVRSYFLYRLALLAGPNGEWSLSLRDRDKGNDLVRDADRLVLPKTWVIGSCSLRDRKRVLPTTDAAFSNVIALAAYRRRA